MKIIHTGDWHIGKLVHGVHMTWDQQYALNSLVELIKDEEPDVLIIAGDLYDRSVPPVEGVELLDDVLTKIVNELGVKVLAIAGNHDSPDRVGFAGKMLKEQGLFISGHMNFKVTEADGTGYQSEQMYQGGTGYQNEQMFRGGAGCQMEPVTLQDEFGEVDFYLMPYVEPAVIREFFGDEEIKSHDDAMKKVMETVKLREGVRSVCVAHGYLTGTDLEEVSDSVRPLSIGGSEMVDVEYFKDFDYVALGHLHRPQRVKYDHIRYAGSLLKYSFSESTQQKSVTLVELGNKGDLDYRYEKLKVKRDMRTIKGELHQLIDEAVVHAENPDDYIMATLTDKGELIDPIHTLRSVYPNILKLEKESGLVNGQDGNTSAGDEFVKKSPVDLFEEFFENITGTDVSEEEEAVLGQVIEKILEKGRYK